MELTGTNTHVQDSVPSSSYEEDALWGAFASLSASRSSPIPDVTASNRCNKTSSWFFCAMKYFLQFLFLSFRRVLNVICSFWVIPRRLSSNCRRFGTHYRFHLHLPMKMEPIVSSETSAVRTQTPGNYPKRNKLYTSYNFLFAGCQCMPLLAHWTRHLPQWCKDVPGMGQWGGSFANHLHADGWWPRTGMPGMPTFCLSKQIKWEGIQLLFRFRF